MSSSLSVSSVRPPCLTPALRTALVTALLALYWWLSLSALIGKSVTHDEPAHLIAGYSYWRFDDYRLQPENGNLPQRFAALPLVKSQPYLVPDLNATSWSNSDIWRISDRFLFGSGNNTDYLVFCARAMAGLWGVAAGLLVFFLGRRLAGDWGGLFSLALFVVSPTALAQGALVTSDMCAAFLMVAATCAWGSVARKVTGRALILSCIATALAFVAKFSCVLLVPIFFLLVAKRASDQHALPLQIRPQSGLIEINSRGRKAVILLSLLVLHLALAWMAIWAFFGWRYAPVGAGMPPLLRYYAPWEDLIPASGFWNHFFALTRGWHLFPDAYLQGFAYVRSAAEARGAFILGDYSSSGWWFFFPYAFLAKSSLAELAVAILVLATLIALLRGKFSLGSAAQGPASHSSLLVPLVVFFLVYGTTSVLGNLNIGQRHILPLYLVLFVCGSLLLKLPIFLRRPWILFLIPVIGAAETTWVRPHYLTFFNIAVGGPANGWRQLVDSSLDWGQDLPDLSKWLQANRAPQEPIYLSYFGTANPGYEGIAAHELSPYFTFGRPRPWFELEPGLYCMTATMLQDVYSNWRGPWTAASENAYRRLLPQMRQELALAKRPPLMNEFGGGQTGPLWQLDRMRFARLCTYLRVKRPITVINYTTFVYRLSAAELRVIVDGSLTQLAELIEHATADKSVN